MRVNYAVCLANFFHYSSRHKLEEIIDAARELGYGIELWREIWAEKRDLFSEPERKSLPEKLQGMKVSVHSNGARSFDAHKFQIEAAACLSAEVLVLHRDELCLDDRKTLNEDLASRVVHFAGDCGVRIAIENLLNPDELALLTEAITKFPQIGVCFDVSHVYFTPIPLKDYLNALGPRIIHVHLQDTRPEAEARIPWADRNNLVPGTGGIPHSDWRLFAAKLAEIGYSGMAVFETQPRNPLQEAFLGQRFMMNLLESS